MTSDEIQAYLDQLDSILDYQTSNGLLSDTEAAQHQKVIHEARVKLSANATLEADNLAHQANHSISSALNTKPLKLRCLYLYALPVWIYLAGLFSLFIFVILRQILNFSLAAGIPAEVAIWGGFGGCVFSVYYLRENVYQMLFSKYYAIYYVLYPIAGTIFGLAIAFVFAGGFISLDPNIKLSYAVYATIAILAGMFQQWVVSTLQDIAQAIHRTNGPSASK